MNAAPGFHAADLTDIRIEQARLLQANARRSAVIVFFIVANTSAILLLINDVFKTAVWFWSASAMILATIAYAAPRISGEITRATVARYLMGHTVLSGMTGLVWGGFAIWSVDPGSEASLFVFSILLVSITLGGLLPGSIYRRGYIALTTAAILPFGTYLILTADIPFQFIGLGFWVYFAVASLASVQNEVNIREGIASRLSRDASAEIARKNVEIEALMQDKSRFVAALSHDLGQPLAAQRHFLAQLEATELNAQQVALLGKIRAAQHNQERLMQDLIDMNLSEPDRDPCLRRVPLRDALERMVTEFEGVARIEDVFFEHDLPDDDIWTEPKLLSRIVRNVLSNAIKFTPVGGTVRLRHVHDQGRVLLLIEDTGVGVPMNQQARIFDEYVQLNAATPRARANGITDQTVPPGGSLGLGLAIVRKLAEALKIEVSLKSVVGQGTCVTLRLPPIPDDAQAHAPQTLTEPGTVPVMVLLLAGAEDPKLPDIYNQLSLAGYRLIHAQNEAEAIGVLAQLDAVPNLILSSDFSQTRSSAEEAISAICEELNDDIPVAYFSGSSPGPDTSAAMTSGRAVAPLHVESIKTLAPQISTYLADISKRRS